MSKSSRLISATFTALPGCVYFVLFLLSGWLGREYWGNIFRSAHHLSDRKHTSRLCSPNDTPKTETTPAMDLDSGSGSVGVHSSSHLVGLIEHDTLMSRTRQR